MLPGKLSFASPSDPACYATVPGCGRSYAFRVAAVDANGHESAFSDPSPVVQTYNDPPVVSISAGSGNVTGTSVGLTASVSDDGLNDGLTETLTYAWSVTPPSGGDAWFDDDTSTTPNLYFTAAGSYSVSLTVDDGYGGESSTPVPLSVTVNHTLSSISASPSDVVMMEGSGDQSFWADAIDQFGDDYTTLSSGVSWSLGGGRGSISPYGVYAPPAYGTMTADASFTVTATYADKTASVSAAVMRASGRYIDFENLSDSTVVTTQYTSTDGVTFGCDSGNCVALASLWDESGIYLTTPADGGNAYSTGFTANFTQPVENLGFLEQFENCQPGSPSPYQQGKTFQINVFENFSGTATALNYQYYGLTTYSTKTWGSQWIDLSQYHHVTSIHVHDITDPWGLWWDNFTFQTAPRLVSLNVTQTGTSNAAAAITDSAIKDLYLAADASGAAHVDLSAALDASMFGGADANSLLHLSITPDSDPAISDTYDNLSGALNDITLQSNVQPPRLPHQSLARRQRRQRIRPRRRRLPRGRRTCRPNHHPHGPQLRWRDRLDRRRLRPGRPDANLRRGLRPAGENRASTPISAALSPATGQSFPSSRAWSSGMQPRTATVLCPSPTASSSTIRSIRRGRRVGRSGFPPTPTVSTQGIPRRVKAFPSRSSSSPRARGGRCRRRRRRRRPRSALKAPRS